jgi:diguanylate cyclase (GGDEF)-like protein
MRRPDGFSIFAVFALCCFAVLALVHREVAEESEEVAARSMSYDVSWTGANGRIEAANLEKYVARYAALEKAEDAERARLFYQILLSRLDTWGSGGYKRFLDQSPERRARFERAREKIVGLASDFENLDIPVSQERILAVLAETSQTFERLGGESQTFAVTRAATIRAELKDKHWQLNWLMFALIASGIGLLALTVLQNWHLRRANQSISTNAERMTYLAKHDALTGLCNRLALDEHLSHLCQHQPQNDRIAVLAIDLDGFKTVNDVMGHSGGDALLVATARKLKSVVATWHFRNTVYRVGGDEFIVIAHIEQDNDDAVSLGHDLVKCFKEPVETGYGNIIVDMSAGVAVQYGKLEPEILMDADLALTFAKSQGKGHAVEFDKSLRQSLHRRIELEAELKTAVQRGDIIPYYQPQFDLASGSVVGFEALARWPHPKLGFVPPDEFIPIAEGSGDVVAIGRSIFEAACLDALKFPLGTTLSVNISVVEILQDDVIEHIRGTLVRTKFPPERLKLEVTESVMMTDLDRILTRLESLRALGIAICLDDFGTGYSALSYLTKFRWDELKIDRTFVMSALTDPVNRAIIRAVGVLANLIDAQVVAEGLETLEQIDLLKKMGCNIGQGYLLGRPMSGADVLEFLGTQSACRFDNVVSDREAVQCHG